MFHFPQSVGFIGGYKNSGLYFFGYQEENLFFLDPHQVQTKVNGMLNSDFQFPTNSYKPPFLPRIKFSQLDPCLSVGFLCQTRRSFRDFRKRVKSIPKNSLFFSIERK
ncbi:cysteine protease atg4 [Anaeramoeba ignava]|uniref:Cysteine protease n=1 Tax=Anaeramoeba ignava TaxID=1746090 RepID=A0A9Q0R5J0_ANAIG|nr:cysteine protease atg4 [Anaeramoeba ignava]|eukprot:Anaeramoba_ignava/a624617_11.p1 GENE.a624617_11~~a624617_11.p1  ORF type:complete len:108 (-),score=36.52 a624617_11:81-404(-)